MSLNKQRIVRLLSLIDTHFRQERKVEFFAKTLMLTPKRTNDIAKDLLGKTTTQLIHERLILEAKRELRFTKKSIKEIAYDLGFEDPAYFSRFFRRLSGVSSQDFKLESPVDIDALTFPLVQSET